MYFHHGAINYSTEQGLNKLMCCMRVKVISSNRLTPKIIIWQSIFLSAAFQRFETSDERHLLFIVLLFNREVRKRSVLQLVILIFFLKCFRSSENFSRFWNVLYLNDFSTIISVLKRNHKSRFQDLEMLGQALIDDAYLRLIVEFCDCISMADLSFVSDFVLR